MIEVKDLIGLSQPLKKLIEVVAQGVGGWAKPWQIKRIANAKAYEIETVAHALRNNSDTLNLLEYDGEKVKMLCEQPGVSPEAAREQIALNERAVSRLTHRERRRQANIEKAVHYAMDELLQEEKVSAEPVDEDWITRFFNIAEDVSNEQMQQLWGRILAGEIKRPKSFSLRTLETMRNISHEETKAFCRIGKYAISLKEDMFVIRDIKISAGKGKIDLTDILMLHEAGLLFYSNHLLLSLDISVEDEQLTYKDKIFTIKQDKNIGELRVKIYNFTKTGCELLSLVDHKVSEEDIDYIFKKIKESDNRAVVLIS